MRLSSVCLPTLCCITWVTRDSNPEASLATAVFKTLCVTISLLSTASKGDDKLGYVLAPLRTEFHRSEISSKASAVLIVNANAIETNQDDDLLATLRISLEDDLRTLSGRTGDLLLIRIQYSGGKELEKDAIVRLKEQLKELSIECGYPTTFWINRRGEVTRYAVGFESGEQLEAELIEFLADEKP